MSRAAFVLGAVAICVPLVAFAGCRKTTMTQQEATPKTREDCEVVRQQAYSATRAISSTYNPPQSCTKDADCIEVADPSCIAMCAGMAIPSGAVPSAQKAVQAVEGRECKSWTDGNCATLDPQPVASCMILRPTCKGAQCTMTHVPPPPQTP